MTARAMRERLTTYLLIFCFYACLLAFAVAVTGCVTPCGYNPQQLEGYRRHYESLDCCGTEHRCGDACH